MPISMRRKTTVVLSDGAELELELDDRELKYLLSVPSSLVIFIRIPETGSQTLARIARRNYGPDRSAGLPNMFRDAERSRAELARWTAKPDAIDLLSGHIAFDRQAPFPPGARYFTMLRDPVPRAISHYNALRRQGVRQGRLPADLSLDDAIGRGLVEAPDNMQTRQLAGAASLDDPPHGQCPPALLDAAIENVRGPIECVGVMERFDESVVLLAETFGWDDIGYVAIDELDTPALAELGPRTVERIRAEQALDLELYEFVTDRFSATMSAAGSELALDLQASRRCRALLEGAEGEPESPAIEERAGALRDRFQRAERLAAQRDEHKQKRRAANAAKSPGDGDVATGRDGLD